MDYFKRQYRLWRFVQAIKLLFSNPNLATHELQKVALYGGIKNQFFSKTDPLNDGENRAIFPVAVAQFKEALTNGHRIESMKRDLDFLQREFDSYFEELVQDRVLLANKSYPPSYRLNHKSSRVYWALGLMAATAFIWKVFLTIKGSDD